MIDQSYSYGIKRVVLSVVLLWYVNFCLYVKIIFQEFTANVDNINVVYNWFTTPLIATYVRLYATLIERHNDSIAQPCLRVELFGCSKSSKLVIILLFLFTCKGLDLVQFPIFMHTRLANSCKHREVVATCYNNGIVSLF